MSDLIGGYGQVIVDECHHVAAFSFERALGEARARYVVVLTATPVRKDGHHPIIAMQCGPVRFKVDARQETAARPFDHRVVLKCTSSQVQIFDYVDANVPMVVSMHKKRLKDYEDIGYSTVNETRD